MSILSGIGQQPPIYGTGGGGSTAITYEIPSQINLLTSGGATAYFIQNLAVPNGNYLVNFVLQVRCGDNTTNIEALRVAVTSGAYFSQTTAIYNTTLLSAYYWEVNVWGEISVANGLVSLEYECDQTGNTSTLEIWFYQSSSGTGLITLYPILAPPP